MTKSNNLIPILANSFIGMTGLAFAGILPVLIGAIVDQYHFEREMVGWISSANILGIALGSIISTLLIGKAPLLKLIRIGLVGMLIFDFASAWAGEPVSMLTIRFASGAFGGLAYAGSLAAFSSLKDSIRAFGIYVMVFCLWSGIILVFLPSLLTVFGVKTGFWLLAGMALVSLFLSPLIKKLTEGAKEKSIMSLRELFSNKAVLAALLGYFTVQMAGNVIWAYTERIAKEAGLNANFIGITLGASAAFSLFGALAVIRIGNKYGIKRPLFFGLLSMAFGFILLYGAQNAVVFIIAISLMGFGWSFVIPYYTQIQAKFDAKGKVVSLGAIMNMGGRAFGPAVAAIVLGNAAFVNVIWIGIGGLVISLILILSSIK